MLSGSIHNCFITRTGRHVTAVNLRPVAIICCLPPQSPGDACTSHALTRRAKEQSTTLRSLCVYLLPPLREKMVISKAWPSQDSWCSLVIVSSLSFYSWSSPNSKGLSCANFPLLLTIKGPHSLIRYSDLPSELHYFICFYPFLHRFQGAVHVSLLSHTHIYTHLIFSIPGEVNKRRRLVHEHPINLICEWGLYPRSSNSNSTVIKNNNLVAFVFSYHFYIS